jgi:hypothetical protein
MLIQNRSILAAAVVGALFIFALGWLRADAQSAEAVQTNKTIKSGEEKEGTIPAEKKTEADSSLAAKLAVDEKRIADRYKHLEEIMLQMAELSAQTDPRRAALLKKVLGQSKEQLVGVRIERLIEFLEKDQLSKAIENQTALDQELRGLLDMLLSENRAKRLQSEKARIREYLKQLGSILKQQKDVQARTVDHDDPSRLAGEQEKIAEKTGGLSKEINKNEEGGADKSQDAGKNAKSGDNKQGENEQERDKQGGDKQHKGGDALPDKQGQPEEQDHPNGDQQGNPARKRLDAAQKRMEEAKKKLDKAQQDGAAKDQEEAIKELEQAKAELEQILRQLREEEIERVLAMLEGRFRKMLEMQREVYEATVELDKVPTEERTHNHEIESSRLSGKEMQIVVEVDKALLVLHEDGTTVAFAEAADQMRTDMQQVVDRLSQAKVGQITQGIEMDIIATLEEMIESLKKTQKDMDKNRQKSNMQVAQQDSPLVDKLAELKMIRALQMQINSRTERYSKLIEGEQAENAELVDALKRLAERQQRVYRVTHDLASGKTE